MGECMNLEELENTVRALHKLVLAQQGAIVAQRVALDSVVSALAPLPQFLGVVNETLTNLEPHAKAELELESIDAFEATISRFTFGLDVMLQRK